MAQHDEPVRAHVRRRAAKRDTKAGQQPMREERSPGAAVQLAEVRRTLRHGPPLQLQAGGAAANRTGLPDRLKTGVEALSGVSLDSVKVHYNSSKPAQLNAHAYAQGSDIHLAPGQEQHLPHEAWHVVQQAQGRVKPTMQMKDGVPVNDEAGLEREAEAMGARALAAGTVQRARDESGTLSTLTGFAVVQRVKVGEKDAGAVFLAQVKFGEVYAAAKTVLDEMKEAKTDFKDVDAIVAAVDADQRVIDAKAAASVAKAAAEAAAKLAAVELQDLGKGVKLRQGDVDTGIWEPIPKRSNGDYQLRTKLSGIEHCYHVHPPKFKDAEPIPGEIMQGGKPMGKQTPLEVTRAILKKHGRPKGW